jgi:hypothetical protein
MSPYRSEDLTEVIDRVDGLFVVLQSPETAGHTPDYVQLASFSTRAEADAFLENLVR